MIAKCWSICSPIIMLMIGLGVFCGCQRAEQHVSNCSEIIVDITKNSKASEFFTGYECVALETNDSCLLSDIKKYDISPQYIALQNKQEILLFDRKGTFKSAFNRNGQGPEEYVNIDALRINDELVYVLDHDNKAINIYTIEGSFVKRFNLDASYIDFYVVNADKIILASGGYNETLYAFAWMDCKSGKITSRFGEYSDAHSVIMWDYVPFAGINQGNVVVNVPFIMTAYQLSENNMIPTAKYSFNTPEQLPTLTLETVNTSELIDKTRNKSLVRQLGHYCGIDSINYQSFQLFLPIRGGYGTHLVKYDNNGKTIAQMRMEFTADPDFPYLNGSNIVFYDRDMVDIINAPSLIHVDRVLGVDYWERKGLSDDSNPVVFFYHLKN